VIDTFEVSGLITKLQFSNYPMGDSCLAQISLGFYCPIHRLPGCFMELTLEFQINFRELEEQFPFRRYAALSPVSAVFPAPIRRHGKWAEALLQ
jgi:hypothetical protein